MTKLGQTMALQQQTIKVEAYLETQAARSLHTVEAWEDMVASVEGWEVTECTDLMEWEACITIRTVAFSIE